MGHDSPSNEFEHTRPIQFRLRTLLLAVGLASIPIALVAWILNEPRRERNRGRRFAAEEWKNGEACLFVFDRATYQYERNGRYVTYWYDREPGLPVSYPIWPIRRELAEGYNETIQTLLKTKGTPSWALKDFHVDGDDLLAALDSDQFQEITEFPCDVTPSIALLTNGTITRPWGTVTCDEFDALVLATAQCPQGRHYFGEKGEDRAYVGEMDEYPHIYFVRVHSLDIDSKELLVFSRDGRLLCQVQWKYLVPPWPPDPRRPKYWPDGL